MSQELPAEIEVHELPGGVFYRLPPRQLGKVRYSIGVPLILFGFLFSGFALFWVGGIVFGGDFQIFTVLFALFGIPFFLAGLAPIAIAMVMIAGRCEIELTGQGLRVVERVGPFYWTWRRPVEAISRLELTTGEARVNGKRHPALDSLAAINVECRDRRALMLAIAYPRDLLAPLANDLARRCNESEHARYSALDPVDVVEKHISPEDADSFEELADQPRISVVDVETHGNGVTFHVPPAGIIRGSKGLFFFSIVWNAFMTLFTGLMLTAAFNGVNDIPLFVFILIGMFWLVGVGMLLGAVNMGRRRAVLAVVDDQLMILQTGIFGNKRWEWARDALDDIRSGPSGMAVNDVPVMELHVHPRAGKKVGLLAGRHRDELRWLATRLRQALELPPTADEATNSDGV